jgi:hypothetical protein
MKAKPILQFALALVAAALTVPFARAQNRSAESATGSTVTAANKFLATLDEAARAKVLFDYQDATQRQRWSNFPTGIFQREGLRLGDLTPSQRDAAMAVLASALSPQGFEKVKQIVAADEVLRSTDGGTGGRGGPGGGPGGTPAGRAGGPAGANPSDDQARGGGPAGGPNAVGGPAGPGGGARGGRGGRGGGGGLIFGQDYYFISFLGKPSATEPWMIQFGGHHLAINITLVGAQGTLAPSHTGAQPAHYEIEGKTMRPLGREVDKAYALLATLDDSQRKQAILGVQMRDLVLGPGRDGQMIQPEGIKGSALTEKQRDMLLDLAGEWTGIMNEAMAKVKMDEMKAGASETWFAWAGPTEPGQAAYFRIQGPAVFIEFSPQNMGGDATNHIHTIYRDPTNDYGTKWSKR